MNAVAAFSRGNMKITLPFIIFLLFSLVIYVLTGIASKM